MNARHRALDARASFAVDDLSDAFDEGEIGIVEEGGHAHEVARFVHEVVDQGTEVHYFEVVHVEAESERGEYRRHHIARSDADDEGDELHGLETLLTRAHDDGEEGDQAAEERDKVVRSVDGVARRRGDAGHRTAREGQTDERHGGPYDHGRHQLGHPFGASKVDDHRDDDVDESRKRRAHQNAQIAERGRRDEGTDECEGTAEEHRALESGEEQIYKSPDARAEDGGGHLRGKTDRNGYGDGRRHYREKLLQCKHQQFPERRLVVDVVDEIDCHKIYLPDVIFCLPTHKKTSPKGGRIASMREREDAQNGHDARRFEKHFSFPHFSLRRGVDVSERFQKYITLRQILTRPFFTRDTISHTLACAHLRAPERVLVPVCEEVVRRRRFRVFKKRLAFCGKAGYA